jgi:hypothetical protein
MGNGGVSIDGGIRITLSFVMVCGVHSFLRPALVSPLFNATVRSFLITLHVVSRISAVQLRLLLNHLTLSHSGFTNDFVHFHASSTDLSITPWSAPAVSLRFRLRITQTIFCLFSLTSCSMAITNITPFIKVDILVNDVVLETYEDDEERTDENTVSKYIESISGADFSIRYRLDKKPDYDMAVDFFLDGKYVDGRYVLLEDFRDGSLQDKVYGAEAIVAGAWMLSKYAFSDLKTSMCTKPSLQKLLTALCSRFRCKELGRSIDERVERHGPNHSQIPLCYQPAASRSEPHTPNKDRFRRNPREGAQRQGFVSSINVGRLSVPRELNLRVTVFAPLRP